MNKKATAFNQITDRDLKLLFVLISLVVLAISYFFGCSKFVNKTSAIKQENQQFQAEVDKLTKMKAEEVQKKLEIAQYNEIIQTIYNKFPGAMTQEKSIDILKDLEEEADLSASSVTFTINDMFYSEAELEQEEAAAGTTTTEEATTEETTTEATATPAPTVTPAATDITTADGTTATENTGVVGYKTTLAVEFTTNYEGLKKAIDFINTYEDKMSIETITVEFDTETGALKGTINLCMYALDGTGAEYVEPKISGIKLGLKDIFGSFNVKGNNRR